MGKNYVRGSYYRTDDYFVSPDNYNNEVMKDYNLSDKLEIHDATLRDGEQLTGVAFSKEDKVLIAKLLSEAGVHRIEAGMPAVSKADEEAIREIVKLDLDSKIFVFSRSREDDVELAADCGVDGIILEIPVNEELIEFGYLWPKGKAVEAVINASRLAHEKGLFVDLFFMDSSRLTADAFIEKVKEIQTEGHVDACTLVDTEGVLSTSATKYMVRKIVTELDIPVGCHFHNNLGLATANTLAAFEQGATTLQTTMLGIGPSAGQAATEQVVLGLKLLYGINSGYGVKAGISMPKLYELAKIVAECAPYKYPVNQPIMGEVLYTFESGMPVTWWQRVKDDHPLALYGVLPSFLGRPEVKIFLGKTSGKDSIYHWLEKLSLTVGSEDSIVEILNEVKDKAVEKKDVLNEEDFLKIVKRYL